VNKAFGELVDCVVVVVQFVVVVELVVQNPEILADGTVSSIN
jgi:hypothetical protein